MTQLSLPLPRRDAIQLNAVAPRAVATVAFVVLYWDPMQSLVRDWLTDPEAGHGLLLAPLAGYLMWKRGWAQHLRPQPVAGILLLLMSVLLRYVSGLAAELFTMRASMMGAFLALLIIRFGWRQLVHWWLPLSLLLLSIPLPSVVLGSLALPLQFQASRLGAAMLEWRGVPIRLSGNVIELPGRALFVTEACSGLRSLSALIALGFVIAGLWLRTPAVRAVLVLAAIPVAMLLNGVRIFLTGFLVYFVDPRMGDGLMHYTEGWVLFVTAFASLMLIALVFARVEAILRPTE